MHYLLSIATALILLGCNGQENPQEKTATVEQEPSSIKKAVAPQLASTAVESMSEDAKLYKQCVSCHGVNAEKVALGKSQIIAGWDVAKTKAALKGYQDGTYGASMKSLMQSQVKSLNDREIRQLAKYINKL